MSNIFLSYSSVDRERARLLATSLEQEGLTVWWDRTIPPGRSFDKVIEDALESAEFVIVLWSQDSINSEWVKTEASEAHRRDVLVPAFIDHVKPPLAFRRIQAVDLVGWSGNRTHPEFVKLVSAVKSRLKSPDQINVTRDLEGTGDAAGPSSKDEGDIVGPALPTPPIKVRRARRAAATVCVLFLFWLIVAVTQGDLEGSVKDASTGEYLVGANVVFLGTRLGSSADAKGHFAMAVPPGAYTLRASYVGYRLSGQASVHVGFTGRGRVDFSMVPF